MVKKLDFKTKFGLVLFAVLISNLAGFIGSFFTITSIDSWYRTLAKPSFNPPNWIFGPVWTLLYILMGIGLGTVLIKEREEKEDKTNKTKKVEDKFKKAKLFFFIQLVLNSLWSILFFGLQNPGLALAEIILLFVFIVLTIKAFYRISKKAAYLLIPYILWVSFASILNFFIVKLN